MSSLWEEVDGVFTIMIGANIESTIVEAIARSAEEEGRNIAFEFNGVTVSVLPDSDPVLIYRDWLRARSGYTAGTVGPHPNPVLTDEEQASDARIEEANAQRRKEKQAEWKAEADAKREATEARLEGARPMEISDTEAWQVYLDNNQDGYGGGVISYAERWARLMQLEMDNGSNLEEIAEATSYEADIDGITGFMYGAAVATLAWCWKYGEQLRCWHNLKTQYGNEGEIANETGGVLNPAVLILIPQAEVFEEDNPQ